MKFLSFCLFSSLIIGAASCQKDVLDDLSVSDTWVYTTYKDSSADFSSYTTFKIADSVSVVIDGTQEKKQMTSIDSAYIADVKAALVSAGYSEATGSETADLGVNVNKLINYSNVYYTYGNYWGYYGSFWDPGFYWGYPGYSYMYPTFVQSVTIADAGISVNILDLKNADTNNDQLKLLWLGLINGYGVTSNSDITQTKTHINALFSQASSYLKK